MKKIEGIIFDMDGTLYSFDQRNESQFTSSDFGKQIYANCVQFFQQRFSIDTASAEEVYSDLSKRYNGEVSLAVEQEFGIDRSEYFAFTWNLQVENFVRRNQELVDALQKLTVLSGVLTSAPKVWTEKVLQFMQIRDVFKEAVFTGDPDLRKPNPQAFLQLSALWGLNPSQVLAMGDQEETDILPAKSLGMKTLRIAQQAKTEADFMAPNVISALFLLNEKGII